MADQARLVTLIPVRKMGRAIEFYTKKLGAKVVMRGEGPMKDYWSALKVGGVDVWFTRADKTEKRKLAYQNFTVKNIQRYVAQLQKKGIKFEKAEKMSRETKVEGPIAFDTYGASAFFHDSEGNLLMVYQAP